MIKKTIIINRAVPGSGKTTITNCIVDKLKKNNISLSIHSADEYFMIGSKYVFNIAKLYEHHQKNLNEFKNSILNNLDMVICDNTNIAPWQTEPYTQFARENNYQIIIITLDPRELSKHVESQRVTPQKPDAHKVSEDVLKTMIEEYLIYDDLLNPKILIEKDKHMKYRWDIVQNKKIIVGIANHFDSDFIIRILPNEYQKIQKNIGDKILDLIYEENK